MSGDLDRVVHAGNARTDGIDFVMVGLKRPAGGVRLYATRHMPHLDWGQVRRGFATLWHIDADMDNLLVIDKPDYPQALARLFEIWGNQDRQAAIEARQETDRQAQTRQRELSRTALAIGAPELRARSCPSCHSMGAPDGQCADVWHQGGVNVVTVGRE